MPTLNYVQDWRRTPIRFTALGASSDPFAPDAAIADVERRKQWHRVLDKACSAKSISMDRALALHTALDRLLDNKEPEDYEEEPESESQDEQEELPTIELKETGRDADRPEVAMDGGKCGAACRIQDTHVPARKTVALDAAHNDMAQTVIAFWKQYGVNLQKVKP